MWPTNVHHYTSLVYDSIIIIVCYTSLRYRYNNIIMTYYYGARAARGHDDVFSCQPEHGALLFVIIIIIYDDIDLRYAE